MNKLVLFFLAIFLLAGWAMASETDLEILLEPGETKNVAGIKVTCKPGAIGPQPVDPSIQTDSLGYQWKRIPGANQAFPYAKVQCSKQSVPFQRPWRVPSRFDIEESNVRYRVDFWTSDIEYFHDGWRPIYAVSGGDRGFKLGNKYKTRLHIVCVR